MLFIWQGWLAPVPSCPPTHYTPTTGGTFADIRILPLADAVDVTAGTPPATNAPVLHQLEKRCLVEIKRI